MWSFEKNVYSSLKRFFRVAQWNVDGSLLLLKLRLAFRSTALVTFPKYSYSRCVVHRAIRLVERICLLMQEVFSIFHPRNLPTLLHDTHT